MAALYGGTSANVAITIKKLVGVVVVPTTAISYTGNATSVKVSENGATTSRDMTIGIASGGETQVVSGLNVGDKVVVPVLGFGVASAGAPAGVASRVGAMESPAEAADSRVGADSRVAGAASRVGRRHRMTDPSARPALFDTQQFPRTSRVPVVETPVIELTDVRKVYSAGTLEVDGMLQGLAISCGSARLKISFLRSSASLCSVTSADHFRSEWRVVVIAGCPAAVWYQSVDRSLARSSRRRRSCAIDIPKLRTAKSGR